MLMTGSRESAHAPLKGVIITILMLGLSLSPLIGSVTAETTVTQFDGGLDSVTLNGNGTVDLALERNTTVTGASFEIRYEVTDPSPGAVQMDIGNDGLHEWRFGGTRDGDLGKQTRFSDNSTISSSNLVPGNWLPTSWTFDVPTQADIDMAEFNLSFEPDVGGAVISSGSLDDMISADIDGDGIEEIVVLDKDHSASNGSGSYLGIVDWTASSGFSTISWVWTCSGATNIMIGDANNDSQDDVFLQDSTNGSICLHLSTSSGLGTFNNIICLFKYNTHPFLFSPVHTYKIADLNFSHIISFHYLIYHTEQQMQAISCQGIVSSRRA